MRKIKNRFDKGLWLTAMAVMIAVVGGVSTVAVMAAIPSSGGIISACYDNRPGKGELRVVDVGQGETCKNNETALNWSQGSGSVLPQTLSNRIEISQDDPGGQTLLTLPGFGDFKTTACIGDAETGITFTNTSSLNINLSPTDDNMQPGQVTGNIVPMTSTMTFVVGKGNGSDMKLANVNITSAPPNGVQGCRYQIFATID